MMALFEPASFFVDICRHHGITTAEVGVYSYRPQTIDDQRIVKRLPLKSFTKSFDNIRRKQDPSHDIAIHSRVIKKIAGKLRTLHIPMLDLAGCLTKDSISELQVIAKDFGAHEMAIFESGRSYHVYFSAVLAHRDWVRFMGRCLLLNRPHAEPIADARWIGHRLLGGYASLRWTKQNAWYKAEPVLTAGFDLGIDSNKAGPRIAVAVQPWLFSGTPSD